MTSVGLVVMADEYRRAAGDSCLSKPVLKRVLEKRDVKESMMQVVLIPSDGP